MRTRPFLGLDRDENLAKPAVKDHCLKRFPRTRRSAVNGCCDTTLISAVPESFCLVPDYAHKQKTRGDYPLRPCARRNLGRFAVSPLRGDQFVTLKGSKFQSSAKMSNQVHSPPLCDFASRRVRRAPSSRTCDCYWRTEKVRFFQDF